MLNPLRYFKRCHHSFDTVLKWKIDVLADSRKIIRQKVKCSKCGKTMISNHIINGVDDYNRYYEKHKDKQVLNETF